MLGPKRSMTYINFEILTSLNIELFLLESFIILKHLLVYKASKYIIIASLIIIIPTSCFIDIYFMVILA